MKVECSQINQRDQYTWIRFEMNVVNVTNNIKKNSTILDKRLMGDEKIPLTETDFLLCFIIKMNKRGEGIYKFYDYSLLSKYV